MVLERELDPLEALLDIVRYGPEITPAHVEAHVDATRVVFARYQVRRRQDARVGHIPQAHLAAVGRAQEQIADIGQVLARIRRAPHHHIVHLPVPVNVADFSARNKCRSRPAYIARFKSIALGLGEVHLNFHVWHVNLDLRVHINGTVDLREGPLQLLGLAPPEPASTNGHAVRPTLHQDHLLRAMLGSPENRATLKFTGAPVPVGRVALIAHRIA